MTRRPARHRVPSQLRTLPIVERLEALQLLSTTSGFVASPMFEVGRMAVYTSPPAGAYTPAQIAQAYGFNKIAFGSVQGDGTGQTIAIVDAYDDPNIQADVNAFDAQFGLPATTIARVNQSGGTSYPATDSTGGWELEESLDVEWAHAVAPGARILLVEASNASDANLLPAVGYAAGHANVVSMSWGGGEYSGETSNDSDFSRAGVAFVASSGDYGAPISWPAAAPNVLAVGGTSLTLGAGNAYGGESGWSGSGGGPSAYEAQPAYQAGVVTQATTRANPDVAYDASSSTGFAVYDSFAYNGTSYGWVDVGGTSAGAPQWAALLAIADQGRALSGQPALDSSSAVEVQTTLYKNATAGIFHDVTTGASTGSPSYSAGPGYDYVTGLGSPVANLVVQSLDGTAPAPSIDHLAISAPTADTAGTSFSLTVAARTSAGATDSGYLGTIRFSSSDVQAGLPASYTFTAADAGSHTFTVTLKTAGAQSITATDATTPAVTGTLSGVSVSPGAATQFVLSGLASSATAGTSQSFTVTAKDAFGNVATGYVGTVSFASGDAQAALPSSYTFAAADHGVHAFGVTFGTAGTQSVTASDAASGIAVTSSSVTVSPAAPINLAASAASTSQINLTWSASAGATGYTIQRSTNGTSWSTVGTTAAGTASYQDTGLASGTTYSYRVQANGGSGSAFSNTAVATTSGTSTSVTDDLWDNSYTPSENAYAYGSYELGLKFQSTTAGTVTAIRFYKQTWMGGYTHVGHLWSSTGALLATATFTGESSYGWQQVTLSSPVAIGANTVYVVSFSTGGGYFGITQGYFNGSYTNGPLTAPSETGIRGGNGVYGSSRAFPTVDGGAMNFWVDVAFSPNASAAVAVGSGAASRPLALVSPGANTGGTSVTSANAATAATARPSVATPSAVTSVTRAVPQALTLGSFLRKVGQSLSRYGA